MLARRTTLVLLFVYAAVTAYSVAGLPPGVIVSMSLPFIGFVYAVVHAGQREGWAGALKLLAVVFCVSLLFESVGVATGWVYGPYHYTDHLGAKFLGLVPYAIPMMWFVMSYPSFVIAERLVSPRDTLSGRGRWARALAVAAVSGLAMTAWDLTMDPVMVARGNWVWEKDGAYFGIPLQNFLGWWVTVFSTYALYLLILRKRTRAPEAGFDRQAVLGYLVTALGTMAASLAGGAEGLALIGFFAMAPWVIAGWLRTSPESQ